MAATASLTLSGTVTGLPSGSDTISITYSNTNSPGLKDVVTLTTTPTAITIPSNTLFVLIIPPASNSINLLMSGATGETVGSKLHPTNPTLIPVPASSPSIFLFCASSTIANVQLYFL
jgi:hypothetical protein